MYSSFYGKILRMAILKKNYIEHQLEITIIVEPLPLTSKGEHQVKFNRKNEISS